MKKQEMKSVLPFLQSFWEALAQMGGRYVLSAVYLLEDELEGLRLMREEAFETPESYYAIYLYEVIPGYKKGMK